MFLRAQCNLRGPYYLCYKPSNSTTCPHYWSPLNLLFTPTRGQFSRSLSPLSSAFCNNFHAIFTNKKFAIPIWPSDDHFATVSTQFWRKCKTLSIFRQPTFSILRSCIKILSTLKVAHDLLLAKNMKSALHSICVFPNIFTCSQTFFTK